MLFINFKPNTALPSVARSLAAIILIATSATASAQAPAAWPTKPISLVVTYPPGGGADAMARLIAPKLGEALGQNVIVENKPGAGGQIGAAAVAKAAPDGYTLMLDASSFAVNPSLYPKLPYDTEKAFRAIGVIALFPNVLVVSAAVRRRKTVAELVAAGPDGQAGRGVSFGSSGNGSAQHLSGRAVREPRRRQGGHGPRALQGRRPARSPTCWAARCRCASAPWRPPVLPHIQSRQAAARWR
jgi:tripartite-type tricarboxylate transporter receptor subunit TctC